MREYPESVAKIVDDYLQRVKERLRLVPPREQDEFLREIQSHIFEAYQETTGEDDVQRILAVLRKMGEPSEVVSDRLPGTMVRSGTKRTMPLHVVAGILIALFGIPLGFGGVGVLIGILGTLAGLVAAYYAVVATFLISGGLLVCVGLIRMYRPELWDSLVAIGVIQMDWRSAELMDQWSPAGQGFLILACATALVIVGITMLWLGRYLVRGLRFLFGLAFDRLRYLAGAVRKKYRATWGDRLPVGDALFAK